MYLCTHENCRLPVGHKGKHNPYPTSAWEEKFHKKDKDKVSKAGYATPRGGDKGAYQNHVYRNNKVIIPFERINSVNLDNYSDGYIIRIFPNQYFEEDGEIKEIFKNSYSNIVIGDNAFVLYRTHSMLEKYPPLDHWEIRDIYTSEGAPAKKRSKTVIEKGHYVLRLSSISNNKKVVNGAPQGIFAPEYATQETNYLCKAFLAWLIIISKDSPYDKADFEWLEAILIENNLLDATYLHESGIIQDSVTSCPLCLDKIYYTELHEMLSFEGASSLANSQEQVEGSTRSTKVNLFHMIPLVYETLEHKPKQISWGHAICNTKLGQRRCLSLKEIKNNGMEIHLIGEAGKPELFGWVDNTRTFMRTRNGEAWVNITEPISDAEE
ncbi:BstXI family restriction endonuclease [Lysinibacillus sp. FSL L8-0312]|uniref:BstXI family restriction endonuclease n=1 Tax=Lysinibacillus sp. FSL L8-0312 TaxID=2921521 RepID=UPI0030F8A075